MKIPKYQRLFFSLFLMILIGGVAYFIYRDQASKAPEPAPQPPVQRYSRHRLRIGGFQFEGHHEGRRVIRIQADVFTIEKMKLGHLRVGLLNVARLRNGFVDLFGEPLKGGGAAPGRKDAPQRAGEPESAPGGNPSVAFKNVFQKESLPSFGVKRVASITIEPITLRLHQGGSLVTEITAPSAAIRLRERDILFKGGVRVVSGARVLETQELSLLPGQGKIITHGPALYRTPEGRVEGKALEADIFLGSVTPRSG